MLDFYFQEPIGFLIRILASAALGALLGLERGIHGRAAGLRTHILVSSGSAVFMIMSIYIASRGLTGKSGLDVVADPGRIAAQIVTGIGFLGAGAIIKEGFTVRGLTTAASLWITAAIGMACGAGFYLIAGSATVIALFSLVVLNYLEKLYTKDVYRTLTVVFPNKYSIETIARILENKPLKILFLDTFHDYRENIISVNISLRINFRGNPDKLFKDILKSLENSEIELIKVEWTH